MERLICHLHQRVEPELQHRAVRNCVSFGVCITLRNVVGNTICEPVNAHLSVSSRWQAVVAAARSATARDTETRQRGPDVSTKQFYDPRPAGPQFGLPSMLKTEALWNYPPNVKREIREISIASSHSLQNHSVTSFVTE